MKGGLIPVLAIASLAFTRLAAATPISVYDNFGPADTYNLTQGFVVGASGAFTFEVGTTFTPATTSFLDQIFLAVSDTSPSPASVLNVSIRSNASNLPGAVLESIQYTGPFSTLFSGGVITLQSVLHPSLIVGTTYWLYASNGNASNGADLTWHLSLTDTIATAGFSETFRSDGSDFLQAQDPAYRIVGTDTVARSVPEPASLFLLVGGLIAVARRRRNSR